MFNGRFRRERTGGFSRKINQRSSRSCRLIICKKIDFVEAKVNVNAEKRSTCALSTARLKRARQTTLIYNEKECCSFERSLLSLSLCLFWIIFLCRLCFRLISLCSSVDDIQTAGVKFNIFRNIFQYLFIINEGFYSILGT